jgi:hypothetical protein
LHYPLKLSNYPCSCYLALSIKTVKLSLQLLFALSTQVHATTTIAHLTRMLQAMAIYMDLTKDLVFIDTTQEDVVTVAELAGNMDGEFVVSRRRCQPRLMSVWTPIITLVQRWATGSGADIVAAQRYHDLLPYLAFPTWRGLRACIVRHVDYLEMLTVWPKFDIATLKANNPYWRREDVLGAQDHLARCVQLLRQCDHLLAQLDLLQSPGLFQETLLEVLHGHTTKVEDNDGSALRGNIFRCAFFSGISGRYPAAEDEDWVGWIYPFETPSGPLYDITRLSVFDLVNSAWDYKMERIWSQQAYIERAVQFRHAL